MYTELSRRILPYRDRQNDLIAFLKDLKARGLPVGRIADEDEQGKETPLKVIDPFTFYSTFNRGQTEENRIAILTHLKTVFGMESEVPSDFDGIPVVNALKAWFFPYSSKRKADDIPSLWNLAEAVVKGSPEQLDPKLFERCLQIMNVGPAKLTMGMFWLNPGNYVACDANCYKLFKSRGINPEVKSLSSYLALVKRVNEKFGNDYPNISHAAWEAQAKGCEINAQQLSDLWKRFHDRISGFKDFGSPGEEFRRQELDYKRKALQRYQTEIGNSQMRKWVEAGEGNKAREEISKRIQTNLVSYLAWRPSIGSSDQQSASILRAYLDVAEAPYAGSPTIEPIIKATLAEGLKPSWDTLSTVLWAMRPSDYFPTKISYYRELAEALGHPLPAGPPTADKFDEVQKFGRAFWKALEPQKPNDWIDVQSFIWVVCSEEEKPGVPITPSSKEPVSVNQREQMDLGTLNLILYGPPGTGKTYQTVNRAVRIADPAFANEHVSDRVALKARFDDLVLLGRIDFITFHQSYSYEDFVEGIRPVLDADEEGGPPRYEC